MTSYQKSQELLAYIESSNTHGRKTLLFRMEELKLDNTFFYELIKSANTNIGKNQLKDLWLTAFIHQMQ